MELPNNGYEGDVDSQIMELPINGYEGDDDHTPVKRARSYVKTDVTTSDVKTVKRAKSDGYVDYAICSSSVGGTCSIMATSASAVSVWPLHFGISIWRASVFDPTCSNIQWLSAAEATTW